MLSEFLTKNKHSFSRSEPLLVYNNTQGGKTLTKYAYVRVSTKEQNVDRQLMALEPYGIQKKNIYCDHQSGKDFDRPEYKRLMRKLRPGDLLVVKSIDRPKNRSRTWRRGRRNRIINMNKFINYIIIRIMCLKRLINK